MQALLKLWCKQFLPLTLLSEHGEKDNHVNKLEYCLSQKYL